MVGMAIYRAKAALFIGQPPSIVPQTFRANITACQAAGAACLTKLGEAERLEQNIT